MSPLGDEPGDAPDLEVALATERLEELCGLAAIGKVVGFVQVHLLEAEDGQPEIATVCVGVPKAVAAEILREAAHNLEEETGDAG